MNNEEVRKACLNSGIVLLILGAIHLFIGALSFEFGIILIITGIISLVIRKSEMFLVFGILLIFIGAMNIISSIVSDGTWWVVLGGFQIFWGINEIRSYLKFQKRRKKETKKKTFVWYGLRISFWTMVVFWVLDKIGLFAFSDSLGYIYTISIITLISMFFTIVLAIIHLGKYRSKTFPVVALVLSLIIFLLTIYSFVLIFSEGFDYAMVDTETQEPITTLNPRIKESEKYFNEIIYEDIELRSFATSMTDGCFSGDKECQLNSIYKYIVNNFKYYSDPRSREFIQSPYDTIKVRGGDCEDLTILLNSLLENIGIKTYIVLTKTHAYSLACGVDIDHLQEEIISSFEKENTVIDEVISIDPYSARIFGGSGDEIGYLMEFTWDIESDKSVDVHVVPSSDELDLWAKGESYTYYPDCSKDGILKASDSCVVSKYVGIMVINEGYSSAMVDIEVKTKVTMIDLDKFATNYYSIGGEKCVVLDSTLGEYGYPGYDTYLEGEKIAIDPVTKETINLK